MPRTGCLGSPMLAVEIYYYHAAEPITIPLHGSDQATAESYVARLKWDVIEAQRHSQERLLISPFDRTKHAQAVKPSEIQRVVLVGRPPTNHRQGPAAKEMHEIGPASTGGGMAGDVCLT